MEKYRLTTKDNPYNPFTQWDMWLFYDISYGYNTCERIGYLAKTSEQLPDEVNNEIIEETLDQLIFTGAFNKFGEFVEYIKVLNPDYDENIK